MIWIIIAFIVFLLIWLRAIYVRRADIKKGWKVQHGGRDDFKYSEFIDGNWYSISIGGEMLTTGKPWHVIYFDSKKKWTTYPEWARDRRVEIITRIKSELKTPHYEYEGDLDL